MPSRHASTPITWYYAETASNQQGSDVYGLKTATYQGTPYTLPDRWLGLSAQAPVVY